MRTEFQALKKRQKRVDQNDGCCIKEKHCNSHFPENCRHCNFLPLPAPPGQSSSTDNTTESMANTEPLPASSLCCQYFACSELLQQIMTTLNPSNLFMVATFATLMADAIAVAPMLVVVTVADSFLQLRCKFSNLRSTVTCCFGRCFLISCSCSICVAKFWPKRNCYF